MSSSKSFLESGKIWPWAIIIAIFLVIGAGALTVTKALENPVQESEIYMRYYQHTMKDMNDIIKARISFDKKYKISFITDQISSNTTTLKYKITTINGDPIDGAKLMVRLTTPYDHNSDIDLANPSVKDGVYTFETVKLPKEGRWNIMAKVEIGDFSRYYNLKADTRYPQTTEY